MRCEEGRSRADDLTFGVGDGNVVEVAVGLRDGITWLRMPNGRRGNPVVAEDEHLKPADERFGCRNIAGVG